MEHMDANQKANVIAIVLGTLGTLFMIAMAFGVLPFKIAIFAGVACYILAGAVRRVMVQRY